MEIFTGRNDLHDGTHEMLRRHYPGGIVRFGHCIAQFDTFDARTRTNVHLTIHLISKMPAGDVRACLRKMR